MVTLNRPERRNALTLELLNELVAAIRSLVPGQDPEPIHAAPRPGDVRYGTTGKPVPGYDVRIVDDDGRGVKPGETGELQIAGPTSAIRSAA